MRNLWLIGMTGCLALWLASSLVAQPFTYQGMLKQNGQPVNGTLTMTFRLYDALTGGNPIGSSIIQNVSVQNGLFTVALDFGAVWTGAERYLEIQVGSTTLSPRVKVTATPYAMYALKPWEPNGSALFYNGGNVGIGTNNPAARLSLGGGNANTKLALWQGSATGEIMGLGVGAGQFRLHLNSSGDRFSFLNAPNGNELVTIKGDGNVGIGTNSPAARLHIVGGNLRVDGGAIQSWGSITLHPDVDNTGDDVVRFVDSGGNETMRIHSDGNVGIGTNSPAARLSLGGGNANTKLALWQGSTAAEMMGLGVGAGQFRLHLNNSGDRFSFLNAPNGNELVTIMGDGKVGIGTSSPSQQLHVVTTTAHRAIYGHHPATSGWYIGVWGQSDSPDGWGVAGIATATRGTPVGVYGESSANEGVGVIGWATNVGGYNTGVFGASDSADGVGVLGFSTPRGTSVTYGVQGIARSVQGRGVHGYADSPRGNTGWVAFGVIGECGIDRGFGVYSLGNFAVAGGAKAFQIDHPLQPDTHYLYHFCTEGPEPYNAYSGNVVTDARGYATVQLPAYFESINRDFRYQLTVIDSSDEFVQAKVVREIRDNQFVIRSSKPFVKVSWRVEAVRNDLVMQRYGFPAEQEKPKEYQGKYLVPELYGQPKEKGIFYHPELEHLELRRPASEPVKP